MVGGQTVLHRTQPRPAGRDPLDGRVESCDCSVGSSRGADGAGVDSQRARTRGRDGNRQPVVRRRVYADLEGQARRLVAVDKIDTVELGRVHDTVDLASELPELVRSGIRAGIIESPVAGLDRELAHPREHRTDLLERTIRRLNQALTPSFALRWACPKPRILALKSSEMARPAASSAADWIRSPEESRVKLLCCASDDLLRFACASREVTLVRTLIMFCVLLS